MLRLRKFNTSLQLNTMYKNAVHGKLKATCMVKDFIFFPTKVRCPLKIDDYSSFQMKFMKLFVITRFSMFLPIILYTLDYVISYREATVLK